jgi:hypothetical protein
MDDRKAPTNFAMAHTAGSQNVATAWSKSEWNYPLPIQQNVVRMAEKRPRTTQFFMQLRGTMPSGKRSLTQKLLAIG